MFYFSKIGIGRLWNVTRHLAVFALVLRMGLGLVQLQFAKAKNEYIYILVVGRYRR